MTAMEETLRGGGDTDTNCAIVGSLLGALHGPSSFPKSLAEKVLNCEPTAVSNETLTCCDCTLKELGAKLVIDIPENWKSQARLFVSQ
jgi:hypothetical protein